MRYRAEFGPVYGSCSAGRIPLSVSSSLASISAGMMRFVSFLFPVVAVPL
jgi:hypothetical protein